MMLDYIGFFRELNKRKIYYIVVGGIAVNLHGIPRMTYDIDLLLCLDNLNVRKFLKLMAHFGFKPKIHVDIMDFANENRRKDWIENKHMKAFNLCNPDWAISEVDIVINTPVDYIKAKKKLRFMKLQNVVIPVISITDLIKMKQKSNRVQDKTDIKYLRKILNEK